MDQERARQRIFMNIFLLANKMQVEGDKLADDLTLKQWMLLLLLFRRNSKDCTINELAKMMSITRQSAKKLVTSLSATGYLDVTKSVLDSRALCVNPTDKAKSFFKQNKDMGNAYLNEVFVDISEDELLIVMQVFEKMKKNLKVGE
ncbi:DNA-binding MarR family transcriptional regulator [Breznakia sp. PF5-3]|uniref:MarR family winged helix-turn-helix transcriptional regulator n=1 Tax=unclassified Breznakia TaxID=2623764 RepID=UPI002406C790|nr:MULTISPECIES: MarR family transcriptional regulator [unclassified Breznakia]MDF9825207.1 DNA-binding MarR family transcriptional regulator [Breznakia sp. PM6-1]MDF9836088.1 DNA-binding MarR family transcriptional regulator [Breznakia sp. PF5-3]MDF9838654.1 DNA-binding MarR family transcriptional regulator [Breznakia sp. PFB2-8]MDF9860685.1 DNA-binding MarR family transcriptional regulator [Breznakia sp. PH5-24]